MTTPVKVSCLCVSMHRFDYLVKAYQQFTQQSYANLEFFVLSSINDKSSQDFLTSIAKTDQRVVFKAVDESGLSLGQLRNLSIEQCNGEYFCIWDDDDIHHSQRISYCLEKLYQANLKQPNLKAATLSQLVIFELNSAQAYLSTPRNWEGTLIAETAYVKNNNIRYKACNKGEDTPLVLALASVLLSVENPNLYIYNVHSNNTNGATHFKKLFNKSIKIAPPINSKIAQIVEQTQTDYDIYASIVNNLPLVSCLTITENRLTQFTRAYQYFHSQTYPNKELVVICQAHDSPTIDYIRSLNDPRLVLHINSNQDCPLGTLRNKSIAIANGQYLTTWDDDDHYSSLRIQRTLQHLLHHQVKAVALSNVLLHDKATNKYSISVYRPWEQTILFDKSYAQANNIKYQEINRGEDTPFVEGFANNLLLLSEIGLYTYTIHQTNTSVNSELNKHIARSEQLNQTTHTLIEKLCSTNDIIRHSYGLNDLKIKTIHTEKYKNLIQKGVITNE